MNIRLLTALVLGIVLASAASAAAQSTGAGNSQVVAISGGGHLVAERDYGLTVSGEVRIVFRRDPGAGCVAHGVCEYSGTAVWKPGSSASATFLVIRQGRTLSSSGFTNFNGDTTGIEGEIVDRAVPGAAAAECADASAPDDPLSISGHGTSLTLAPDVTVAGRCAGPLAADLLRVVPRVTLAAHTLTRSRITLDLSGTRNFAAHGLSGTLSSTIIVTGRKLRSNTQGSIPSRRTHRIRIVSQSLAVVHGSGSMTAVIAGVADLRVCSLLDSCGARGEITWKITPSFTTGQMWAAGPARLPLKAFRVALGLAPGPRDPRIFAVGGVDLTDHEPLHESLTQAGAVCTDSVPVGGSSAFLAVARGALHVSYGADTDGRTRCPGPRIDPSRDPELAGTIALSRARRQFSVHLGGARSMTDDGYTAHQSGSLTLTLRRGRITQRIDSF